MEDNFNSNEIITRIKYIKVLESYIQSIAMIMSALNYNQIIPPPLRSFISSNQLLNHEEEARRTSDLLSNQIEDLGMALP